MGVQRQVEKPSPRPDESRQDHDDRRPEDERDQPIVAPSSKQDEPADDEQEDEDEDEGALTDPEAEPGKPI